ncbi:MAG TPA: S8 family serine peptidase [Solirubrobacteraceae bacterium]|nr:S8 family serine peptidase [Solirubrobacteraceae bacterium]
MLGTAALVLAAALSGAPAAPAASARYDANTVVVKYAAHAPAAQRSLAARTAGVLETLGRVTGAGAQVVRVTGDPAAVSARLNRSRAVLYAEPNFIYRAKAAPNDPLFARQQGLSAIAAPAGWDAGGLGSFPAEGGAKIGIVDTGIAAGHEDFAGKVVACAGVRSFGLNVLNLLTLPILLDPAIAPGRCADDNGHGTHVAGIAAALANNGRGIAGVSFHSPLAICKALDAKGAGSLAGIANCVTYLSGQGAKVISMSLSSTSNSRALADAVAAATASGSLIIAAAGNTGGTALNYPAAYPQVVSVAALDNNGANAAFSTANEDVEVAAPGVGILSTWLDGGYRSLSGTSMATPHAAGAAALIAARNPAGGPAAWRSRLDSAVDDVGPPGRDPIFGFGRVNLQKALAP